MLTAIVCVAFLWAYYCLYYLGEYDRRAGYGEKQCEYDRWTVGTSSDYHELAAHEQDDLDLVLCAHNLEIKE